MTDQQTAERLVRIETNMERMMATLETMAKDQEGRLRWLEQVVQHILGVLKLLAWLGAPTVAAIVLFVSTRH